MHRYHHSISVLALRYPRLLFIGIVEGRLGEPDSTVPTWAELKLVSMAVYTSETSGREDHHCGMSKNRAALLVADLQQASVVGIFTGAPGDPPMSLSRMAATKSSGLYDSAVAVSEYEAFLFLAVSGPAQRMAIAYQAMAQLVSRALVTSFQSACPR